MTPDSPVHRNAVDATAGDRGPDESRLEQRGERTGHPARRRGITGPAPVESPAAVTARRGNATRAVLSGRAVGGFGCCASTGVVPSTSRAADAMAR